MESYEVLVNKINFPPPIFHIRIWKAFYKVIRKPTSFIFRQDRNVKFFQIWGFVDVGIKKIITFASKEQTVLFKGLFDGLLYSRERFFIFYSPEEFSGVF